MASKSSKTLFSLLIIHLFALSQCKSPFKISRMSHVARSTKFRGHIHKGKCRCKFFFFFSYYTFYNGHVCLIPKIPNLICNLFTQPYFFHSHSQRLCKFMRKKENVYIRKKVQLPKEGFRTTTWPSFHCLWTMDLTKLRRRRQREHLKSNRFYEKTTTLHVHHAFLYISWPSLIGKTRNGQILS